jgi:di/tricarboxylate transporter
MHFADPTGMAVQLSANNIFIAVSAIAPIRGVHLGIMDVRRPRCCVGVWLAGMALRDVVRGFPSASWSSWLAPPASSPSLAWTERRPGWPRPGYRCVGIVFGAVLALIDPVPGKAAVSKIDSSTVMLAGGIVTFVGVLQNMRAVDLLG